MGISEATTPPVQTSTVPVAILAPILTTASTTTTEAENSVARTDDTTLSTTIPNTSKVSTLAPILTTPTTTTTEAQNTVSSTTDRTNKNVEIVTEHSNEKVTRTFLSIKNSQEKDIAIAKTPTFATVSKNRKNSEIDERQRIYKAIKMSNTVDCGDKRCTLSFMYKDSCLVYLQTNVTNCNIPCDFSGCEYKFSSGHCRVWRCVDIPNGTTTTVEPITTTTTDSTTSTTWTTISPTPTPSPTPNPLPPDYPVNYMAIGSYLINGALIILVIALLILYLKNCCKVRRHEQAEGNRNIEMRRLRRNREHQSMQDTSGSDGTSETSFIRTDEQGPSCLNEQTTLESSSKLGARAKIKGLFKKRSTSSKAQENPIIKSNAKLPPKASKYEQATQPQPKPKTETKIEAEVHSTSQTETCSNQPQAQTQPRNESTPISIAPSLLNPNNFFTLATSSDTSIDEASPLLRNDTITYESIQQKAVFPNMPVSQPTISLSSDSSLYSTFGRQTFAEHRVQRNEELQNIAASKAFLMKRIDDLNMLSAIEKGKQLQDELKKKAEESRKSQFLTSAVSTPLGLSDSMNQKRQMLESESQQLLAQALQTQKELQAKNDEIQMLQIQSQGVLNRAAINFDPNPTQMQMNTWQRQQHSTLPRPVVNQPQVGQQQLPLAFQQYPPDVNMLENPFYQDPFF